MPRPIFLIILPNAPDAEPTTPHQWALFVPEPTRPSAGKFITLGRSSLLSPHDYVRIYKHGYDLDALIRVPAWEGPGRDEEQSQGQQGERRHRQDQPQERRHPPPRYERLYLGSVPDSWVVDLVREDQSTGADEASDVFVVEAEQIEWSGLGVRGDGLVNKTLLLPSH